MVFMGSEGELLLRLARSRVRLAYPDAVSITPPAVSITSPKEAPIAYAVREQIFKRFYEEFQKPLGTFLYHLLANRQEVEDLYQEAFKKFWEYLRKLPIDALPDKEDAKKWLFTVARNQVIDQYRKQKKVFTEPLEDVEQTLFVSILIEDHLCQQELLRNVLACMTPMYRICFVLQVIYGYSQQEIADLLGIGKKTVSSNVLRGRKQLSLALNSIRQYQEEEDS